MATYVVHAQVAGVRLQRAERGPAGPTRPAMTAPAASAASAEDQVTIDIVGRGLEAVIRERWTRVAEIWAQTTFYLFDTNSWR